jgi:hypothetical protein
MGFNSAFKGLNGCEKSVGINYVFCALLMDLPLAGKFNICGS